MLLTKIMVITVMVNSVEAPKRRYPLFSKKEMTMKWIPLSLVPEVEVLIAREEAKRLKELGEAANVE
jgi:hypothetical protein